jgi:dTDP-glucose pyrophosphorylase
MAGAGSRFEQAGYTFPKPLIDVEGKPMIQVVVDNLNIDANFIFIVQKSHREKYNLDTLLNLITPGCKIVEVDGVTEGAAVTTLLAKEYINNDAPLLMANSDQF